MARRARVAITDCPHHVTHRGNLRAQVFFSDDDRLFYLGMLEHCCVRFNVEIWAYCLMTNHVHLVATPRREQALSRAVGLAHQRFASAINARHHWTGNLWADRFFAAPLDDEHLWTAVRYVELNPVRAGIVANALDYPWSSARCHAGLAHSTLLHAGRPFPGTYNDWAAYLAGGVSDPDIEKLRWCTSTGRPYGSEEFIRACEEDTGRILRPMKPGPKVSPSASTDLSEDLFGLLK